MGRDYDRGLRFVPAGHSEPRNLLRNLLRELHLKRVLRLLLLCHRSRLSGLLQQCPVLLQPLSTCSKSRGNNLRLLLQLLLLLLHLKHGERRLYCQHLLLHHQLLLHQALLLQQLMPLHLLPELIFQASDRVGVLLLVELRPRRANLQRFFEAKRDALLANSNVLVRLFLASLLLLALSALATCSAASSGVAK